MSYIPKYIIKRLIPEDAVKVDGELLKIKMVNVISPISIDEVPDDVLNYLEVKVDDEVVLDATKTDMAAGMKLIWNDQEFTLENIKDAQGQTLPVGGELIVCLPNPGLEVGSTHKFAVTIKTDNPINVEFEREVKEA
jgi:hypothetical protein